MGKKSCKNVWNVFLYDWVIKKKVKPVEKSMQLKKKSNVKEKPLNMESKYSNSFEICKLNLS